MSWTGRLTVQPPKVKKAQPGDVITANAYTQGIMFWCFRPTTGVSAAPPGGDARAELDGRGRNVWYVLIGPVWRHGTTVPYGAWARRDTAVPG